MKGGKRLRHLSGKKDGGMSRIKKGKKGVSAIACKREMDKGLDRRGSLTGVEEDEGVEDSRTE